MGNVVAGNREKYRYFQIIPASQPGFDVSSSKALLSQLSSLSNPRVFSHLLSDIEIKLIIDNRGKNKRLRLIIGLGSRYKDKDIKKIISDIDPLLELKIIEPKYLSGQTSSYSLSKHYAYLLKTTERSFTPVLSAIKSNNASVSLEINLKSATLIRSSYLRKKLLAGQTPKLFAGYGLELVKKIFYYLVILFIRLLQIVKYILEEVVSSTSPHHVRDKSSILFIEHPGSIKLLDKLYDDLWLAKISTTVHSPTLNASRNIDRQLNMALINLNAKGYQKLRKVGRLESSSVLSSSELAAMFHMPNTNNEFEQSSFKMLPAQPELVHPSPGSVILGDNIYGNDTSVIRLSRVMRSRHCFILGATGSGKTTLLQNMINQDILNGSGTTIIDPHGDLAESLLGSVPKDRINDVIYFDPSDINHPVGINLLEIKAEKGSTEYRLELDLVVEAVISILRKLFSEDGESGGHRIEYLIRNSVYSVMTLNNPTIFSVYRILTDPRYRSRVISKLSNPDLINFWNQEIGKAGDFQRVKMTSGVTSKIGRLMSSAASRRVFGQPKSTIDFDEILNEEKILICNFSKGKLGEDLSRVFGISILAKLQLAALKRASIPTRRRHAHYVYIDEFQNFDTPAASQLVSESRKYGVYLSMANQSLSQLDERVSNVILANVGNLIVFRTPFSEDENKLIDIFKPYLSRGDLTNLPSFNCYLKASGLDNIPPVSLKVRYLVKKTKSSHNKVLDHSRKAYALRLKPV